MAPVAGEAAVETVVEDAPVDLARDRVRFKTPDRSPSMKRTQDNEGGPKTLRHRPDDGMDDDGPVDVDGPLHQWYGDAIDVGQVAGASMDG